jgi:hypothetical protein
MGAEKLQDYAIEKIVSPETKKAIDEQFAKDAEKQPVASFAGQVAPSFALFRPSPSNLAKAGSFAKQIMSGQVTKEALETPAVREQASNLLNVAFGAGTQTGLEAYGQFERGEFDPLRLGASVVIGALQTEPTRLGKATITEPMARMEEAIRARKTAQPEMPQVETATIDQTELRTQDQAQPTQEPVATTEPQAQEAQVQPTEEARSFSLVEFTPESPIWQELGVENAKEASLIRTYLTNKRITQKVGTYNEKTFPSLIGITQEQASRFEKIIKNFYLTLGTQAKPL